MIRFLVEQSIMVAQPRSLCRQGKPFRRREPGMAAALPVVIASGRALSALGCPVSRADGPGFGAAAARRARFDFWAGMV
jgi:hypothetical protein